MTARYFIVSTLLRQAQGGYANLVLDAALQKNPLEPRDKAFATAVFYSVLEHQNTLDFILNQFLKKKIDKLDAPIREILRSGLAQARYMDVPASAAVNESVKLAKAFHKTSAAGMVNAVLRRAISYELKEATFANETERVMVLGSVSAPLAKFFLKHYPEDALTMLTQNPHADANGHGTVIRVNTLRTDAKALTALLLQEGAKAVHEIAGLPHALRVQFCGSPAQSEAFAQGLFHVEGETSQFAALSLSAQKGDCIIDFCAAPGGKSLAIAQEMQDDGVLYSCDVSQNRVSLIEKAVVRAQLTCVKAVQNNAATETPTQAWEKADRILVDVPCSGLGILAKKPDIRYKDLAGMADLLALQSQILDNAAAALKDGGRLVYSTCTINPDENERQIEAFLARNPAFSVLSEQENKSNFSFPEGMTCTAYGAVSLPHKTGLDGFFICTMEKHSC